MSDSLRSFLRELEHRRDLVRIKVPVDAELEITEIVTRVVRSEGPALLFENVKGSSFPLVVNILGAKRRIELALGRPAQEVGRQLAQLADAINPPKLGKLFASRKIIQRALSIRNKVVQRGMTKTVEAAPQLSKLPILKCWPKDGGRFITFPLVITKDPEDNRQNMGIYRMQVYDDQTTGMHWQIQKGGGFHYSHAQKKKQPLPVSVALTGDPLLLLAGVLPLPEGLDEMAFSGFLRGRPTRVLKTKSNLVVPEEAEFILNGFVPPQEVRPEGPFGDHFGHYSHRADFPVFHVETIWHRKDAVYPAAVVGKPPQEDLYLGDAIQEMLLPLLRIMHPEIVDLWAYAAAGFHNLAVAAVRQRYEREALKTAFALLGEGQMSLTKVIVLVDPDVNTRDFPSVLRAIRQNFDPAEDFILLGSTAQDTLDFTGHAMNLGSKMVIDATKNKNRQPPTMEIARPIKPEEINPHVMDSRSIGDSFLIVRVKGDGRNVISTLIRHPALKHYKVIAAVSADVPLNDPMLLIWGVFTRFDCARDIQFKDCTFSGIRPIYRGPMGIDATWKVGYPESLEMDEEIVKVVDRRWKEYEIKI